MSEPYLKLARRFFEHPLWEERRMFSRAEAWLDLVQSANFRDREVMVQGRPIVVKRGEVVASVRFLCKRWAWSIAKTKRFLDRLETDTMIGTATEQGVTVITLCNYEAYNAEEKPAETTSGTPDGTIAEHSRNTRGTLAERNRRRKEGKKERREEELFPLSSPAEANGHDLGPVMARVGSLFRRRSNTPWSEKERKALGKVIPINTDDLSDLETFYGATIPEDEDYRRRNLETLLNNWAAEVDKARRWIRQHQKHDDRYEKF